MCDTRHSLLCGTYCVRVRQDIYDFVLLLAAGAPLFIASRKHSFQSSMRGPHSLFCFSGELYMNRL